MGSFSAQERSELALGCFWGVSGKWWCGLEKETEGRRGVVG
jgi:peptide methionine sulfoxide reductase MsrA